MIYSKLPRASDDAEDVTGTRNHKVAEDVSSPPTVSSLTRVRMLLLSWTALFLAIMSGAAIGPAFKWMQVHHVSEIMAASWRCQAMVVTLLPIAVIEARYFRPPWDWFTWKTKEGSGLKYPVYIYVIVAGFAWSVNLVCWITGLRYTTTVRASIFSGCHPLLLVWYYYFTGEKITAYEWSGVLLSFSGLLFIAMFGDGLFYEIFKGTTSFSRQDVEPTGMEAFGDCICLLAAAAEVVVLVNRSKTKEYVPTFQYTFLTTCIVAFTTTVLAAIFCATPHHIFSTDEGGIFGWLAPKWFYTMFIFGFVVGVVCVSGFNFAMNYIQPLVFSCVLLVDPAVTGIISWVMGIEEMPDVFTILGGCIVIGGVFLVTYGEHHKELERERDARNISFEMVRRDDDDLIWRNSSLDDSDEDDEESKENSIQNSRMKAARM